FGLILYLTQVWRYSTLRAGLAMTPGPLVVMPFAVLGGRIAARRGHRDILVLGGLAFAVSGLLMLVLRTAEPAFLSTFLGPACIIGLGIGFVLPSLSSVAAHGLPAEQFGIGVAVNQAVRQVGSVIGVALVIAFTARAPAGSLRPYQALFALLIVSGLLV